MRSIRSVSAYMGSTNISINASLTLLRVYKRIRTFDPAYKPTSRYQARIKHKRAARRMKPGIVR